MATPSAQNCILTPGTEGLLVALGKEGIFREQCEIWPLPKAEHPHMAGTVGEKAELTGAIPAQLCLPSSRPRASLALLPTPGTSPQAPGPGGGRAHRRCSSRHVLQPQRRTSGARPSPTRPASPAAPTARQRRQLCPRASRPAVTQCPPAASARSPAASPPPQITQAGSWPALGRDSEARARR